MIFAKIIATITRKPRYFPAFEWSKLLTHNVFRAFGMIFGEQYGVRPSVVSWEDEGVSHQIGYTLEAQFALFEMWARSFFSRYSFKIISIPQMQLAEMRMGGITPYRFAIAFDAASGIGPNSATLAHTCTGTNLFLHVGQVGDINLTNTITSIVYNLVTMTLLDNVRYPADRWTQNAILVNPSTGTNNIVSAGASFNQLGGVSYTGCAQSGQPDSHAVVNGAPDTVWTATTTVVASNCWISAFHYGDPNTAGAGTTLRGSKNGGCVMCDSNGTVSTGNQSLIINMNSTQNQIGEILSIAPPAGGTVVTPARSFGLMGVGQ